MRKMVVNVATGHYVVGQRRLLNALKQFSPDAETLTWADQLPAGSPTHQELNYAFKGWAMVAAAESGADLLLWCDASILPIADLAPLWDLIERQGTWFSDNGWTNGQWCSDAALPLFAMTREEAFGQRHVMTTAFGLNLRSQTGKLVLSQFFQFACNGSFHGPWKNDAGQASTDPRVLGHRHDQTAASVIAHRLGIPLSQPPAIIAYKGGETAETILLADGCY
jgi:hypothetical protein